MKKFVIIAAVALVAMSMQAAQINWGMSGKISYNGTYVADKATLTLVCLDGVTDWEAYAKDIVAGKTTDGVAATKNTNKGSTSTSTASPYTFDWAGTTSLADKQVKSGTDFAFVVSFVNEGKSYFWASDVYTVQDSGENWDGTSKAYTMSVNVANAMGADGSKWTAVPEPASAMLALAGVAMLIRRRK